MKDTNRSIFRAAAVQHYMQSREKAVLPRIISPRTFVFLWVLFGLLLASGLIAWLTRVPVYASGQTVIVDLRGQSQDAREDDLWAVVFLPPENLSHLRSGQKLFLRFDTTGGRLSVPIAAVEPEIISPDAAQRRFALSAPAALAVSQPAAVATAPMGSFLNTLPSSTYVGSIYPTEVEVGSRRTISLLPLIGQLLGE
jgi:hypothetical protein